MMEIPINRAPGTVSVERLLDRLDDVEDPTGKTFTSPTLNTPEINQGTQNQPIVYDPLIRVRYASIITTFNPDATSDAFGVYVLNLAAGFVVTLPAPSAGASFTFVVGTAPSGGSYTIVTTGGSNIIHGVAVSSADAGGNAASTAGTGADTITLVDGQAKIGDRVELFSDGTSWFAHALCSDEDAVTFTAT